MRRRRGRPRDEELDRGDHVGPKGILEKLVKKYLPEFMPQILPGLMVMLMADLLAKPQAIRPDWVEYLDEEFDLPGFVKAHYEAPLDAKGLTEILEGYEPEDAIYMVYALAAYIKFNRLKVEFPGVKRPGKPRRKKTKRTIKKHPGKGRVSRRKMRKVIKETTGRGKAAPKEKITVPGMLREMLGQEPTATAVEKLRDEAGSDKLLAEMLNNKLGGRATAGSISVYLSSLRKKAGGHPKRKERDAM